MIKKLLIANRGEIARRIIRCCRRLQIQTVAVYSDADRDALHVAEANEAYRIGGPSPADSYLNVANILRAVKDSRSDAVHPGYGFLAENGEFAQAVSESGVCFVGPSPECMKLLGEKDRARELANGLGIPVAKGVLIGSTEKAELEKLTSEISFPILLKAALGGGGRGMRLVRHPSELEAAVESAAREAKQFFSSATLLMEEFISPARHVEIQLLGDKFGSAVHFFERDCSAQRRSQKTVEESPARNIPEALLDKLYASALQLAKAGKLLGLATAEFLVRLDETGRTTGEYFFLEVNPRIQVEHPVTEMVTGVDLVEEQLRVTAGEKLRLKQKDIKRNGHVIQARLYAEIPELGFLPSEGSVSTLRLPAEVPCKIRVEHALSEQGKVETIYDSMLAKVIVWGKSFDESKNALLDALNHTVIAGIPNNLRFLERTISSPEFVAGTLDTRTLETWSQNPITHEEAERALLALLSSLTVHALESFGVDAFFRPGGSRLNLAPKEWNLSSSHSTEVYRVSERLIGVFRNSANFSSSFFFEIGGREEHVQIFEGAGNFAGVHKGLQFSLPKVPDSFDRNGEAGMFTAYHQDWFIHPRQSLTESESKSASSEMFSPFPGTILKILSHEGSEVRAGETVFIIESMKMEHQLPAPRPGTFTECEVKIGSKVSSGSKLCRIQ